MNRWRDEAGGEGLTLTGLRLGESALRDEKIARSLRSTCAAGGECGTPTPGEGRYSPILHWTTCQVVDWIDGLVAAAVRRSIADLFDVTRHLVAVYGFRRAADLFDEEQITSSSRFGCIGCPAIATGPAPPRSLVLRHGADSPLCELYAVWADARLPENRLSQRRGGRWVTLGPLRVEARRRLFERVVDIQRRAGIMLVTEEDEAFIRKCWADKVYPRGWSAADEDAVAPAGPLFDQ